MADININPSADTIPYPDFTGAAVEGAQAGQTLRGISALQGIDLDDPDSFNRGIGNLVRAGAADQASAMMGLQLKRGLYSSLPSFISQATAGAPGSPMGVPPGSGAPPGAAAPSAAPTGQPSGTAATAAPGGNPALAAMHAEIAKDALDYGQTDPKMQPVLADVLKAKYAAKGIDPAAIDTALSQSSTPAGATQFAAMHTAHAQLQTQGNGDGIDPGVLMPPAAQPPPGDASWSYEQAKNYLAHPQWSVYEAMLKSQTGVDLGLTARAQAIMGPEFSKEAEVRNAPALGTIAAQTAGKTTAATQAAEIAALPQRKAIEADLTPPVAGASPTFDVNGNHIGWHMPDGSLQALASTEAARASGGAAVRAQYEHFPLPVQGQPGVTVESRMVPGPNGIPVPAPLVGGALPTGAGTSAGIASEHNAAAQSDALSTQAAAAHERLNQYPAQIARSQTLLAEAGKIGTGAYTPTLLKAAQALPISHSFREYAANAGLLTQDLAASFKDALQGLPVPRITSEAKSITGAIPSSASQQDQVKVYAASILAANQYHQAHDQFIQQWAANSANPRDLSQAEAAWQSSAGGRSLFAMPAWQGVTIAGEPAVQTVVHKNGGTYLVPLHGLLGKDSDKLVVRAN